MANKNSNQSKAGSNIGGPPTNSRVRTDTETTIWNSSRSATTRSTDIDATDIVQSPNSDRSGALAGAGDQFPGPAGPPMRTIRGVSAQAPTDVSSIGSFSTNTDYGSTAVERSETDKSATVDNRPPKRRGSTLEESSRYHHRTVIGTGGQFSESPHNLSESDDGPHGEDASDDEGRQADHNDNKDHQESLTPRG